MIKRGIEILKHKTRAHYIVRVSPAMDGLLLHAASESGISPSDFGLPTQLEDFIDITKDAKAEQNVSLRRFIKKLRSCPKLEYLHRILCHLNLNRFKADLRAWQ